MKRVFVFQDFKSQKFWSIEVVGTDVTVNYGKLGTDGQTQVKNYATTEEAEKAAGKLIAEKTKKGYVETAEETAREMKVEAKKYTLSYDEYENLTHIPVCNSPICFPASADNARCLDYLYECRSNSSCSGSNY